jgi:hypothetical protein
LVHIDVKKLGNIPEGDGWQVANRPEGIRNRAVTRGPGRSRYES